MKILTLKKGTPDNQKKKYKLRVIGGPLKGHSFTIIGSSAVIGRIPGECDIVLHDSYCSRKHALIIRSKETDSVFIKNISKKASLLVNKKDILNKIEIKNADIIQIGQTEFKLEISMSSEPILLPPPGQAPPYMERSYENKPKAPKSRSVIFKLVILILLMAGLYLFFNDTGSIDNQKGQLIQLRTEEDIQLEKKQLKEHQDYTLQKKREYNNLDFKNAQIAYLKGIRDYRQGLFGRAIENFRVCRTLYPKHKLCTGALKNAQIKYEQLAQRNTVLGKQYKESRQFKQCAASFQVVKTMMAHNQLHPLYKEAHENLAFCQLNMRERY